MALKVIGAGFGRTGTMSLKLALERLGFGKCYHMMEVVRNPGYPSLWAAVLDGEPDWDAVFDGYRSSVDWPAAAFYKEQMNRYPDAKVVLTVRNPESWYRSVSETIYPLSKLMPPVWLMWLKRFRHVRRLTFESIWDGTFDGRFEDRDHAIGVFNEHIEAVRRHVPPERLLVFDVREGWGPLCEFLGIANVPDEPFPHVNEGAAMKRQLRAFRLLSAAVYGVLALLLAWGIVSLTGLSA